MPHLHGRGRAEHVANTGWLVKVLPSRPFVWLCRYLVAAGDPHQLPPVIASPAQLAAQPSAAQAVAGGSAAASGLPADGLLRPLFVRLSQLGHEKHLLRLQYRYARARGRSRPRMVYRTLPAGNHPHERFLPCMGGVLRGSPVVMMPPVPTTETCFSDSSCTADAPPGARCRCHPVLSAIPNESFYNHELRDGCVATDRAALLPGLPPLVFVDTGPGQAQYDSHTGSSLNHGEVGCGVLLGAFKCTHMPFIHTPEELPATRPGAVILAHHALMLLPWRPLLQAQLVARAVQVLLQCGVPAADIGVICFYRAQARAREGCAGTSRPATS